MVLRLRLEPVLQREVAGAEPVLDISLISVRDMRLPPQSAANTLK
jgi:hypothetical protein